MGANVAPGKTAVVLLAHGAVERLEDLPKYLHNVLGGRPVPPALLKTIRERYAAIGGCSPLTEIARAQARALEIVLSGKKDKFPVYIGMRHWEPTIRSAVEAALAGGAERLVSLPMTPYYSKISAGAYLGAVREAIESLGAPLEVLPVEGWHDHPLLIESFVDKAIEARAQLPESLREEAMLLLTAHSLPESAAPAGDAYPSSLRETAQAVAHAAGFSGWRFAYQSKGGGGSEAWLGPDAGDVIEKMAGDGVRSMVLSPVGFVSDHMETLYDDDILYKGIAEKSGMAFSRAEALNTDPKFIAALADVSRQAMGRVCGA